MSDKKISQLTAATTPLAGTELVPVVQGGVTKKVPVSDLTAGRSIAVAGLASTGQVKGIGLSADYFTPQLRATSNDNLGNGQDLLVGYNTTTDKGYIQAVRWGTGYKPLVLNPNGGNVIFGNDKTTVFESGGVSIGNTTDPGATNVSVTGIGYFGKPINLGSKVQVNSGTSVGINTYVSGASTDGTAGLSIGKVSTTNTSSQVFCEFWINAYSTASGRIVANGASSAAFASYSDRRLKENIVPLPSQLANINALKPSEFDYKDGSGHQIGFIAQDHQQIYPDDVSEDDKGVLSIVGWSKTEARLVSAIQELSAQVTQLQAQVKALEAK